MQNDQKMTSSSTDIENNLVQFGLNITANEESNQQLDCVLKNLSKPQNCHKSVIIPSMIQ